MDDDRSVRDTLADLILSLGYDPEVFAWAEECLTCGHIADAACLISEVQMRGMNGFEMHDLLLAEGYSVPIIFMSAHFDEPVLRVAATAFEGNRCFEKADRCWRSS